MSNASIATSPAANNSSLSSHVQQALDMLDLDPEQELERYRQSKIDNLQSGNDSVANQMAVEQPQIISTHLVTMTEDEDEDEDEDYEVIPPSQPFAVYEAVDVRRAAQPLRNEAAGEMVLTGQIEPEASLDLSFMPPGEIAAARDEYLPASQELWRSLGQPQPTVGEKPIPKWQLPVAIGSVLLAIASVGGMSYVNMHPALLKTVPGLAQLTAPASLPAVPPGQSLQGPDLAMGEFSELNLSNINGIALPNAEPKVAVEPTSVVPNSGTVPSPAVPTVAAAAAPVAPTAAPALTLPPTGAPTRLSDGLMRNLLPPNIQQLAGQSSSPTVSAQPGQPALKPYSPNQLYYQPQIQQPSVQTPLPPLGSIAQPRYTVMTKYVNPLGFAKIQSLVPGATLKDDQIDLGSFPRKSAALATVKKLQQEGVKAWVSKQS